MDRITIIGLGLIGGSIGLGLRAAKLKSVEIVGHDASSETAALAGKKNAVDRVEWNLHRAVEGATLVILAIPVLAIRDVLAEIAGDLQPGVTVTDTGSTKGQVMTWAQELLPKGVHFVGGHPMAGREIPGIDQADGHLFDSAVWVLTPSTEAPQGAIDTVAGLARHLGAEPFFADAEEHDGFVAGVSHLPMVIAATLARTVLEAPAKRELGKLAAGGFRDTTRLAGQSPIMTRDIMLSNRQNIARWLDQYIVALQDFRQTLDGDDETILQAFATAQDERARWMVSKETGHDGEPIGEDVLPATGETVRDMMLGRGLASRIKRLTDITRNEPPPRR